MSYREFTDDGGRAWRVWDTYPQKRDFVSPGFEDGWLSFEAEGEKRRLAPVPPGWEEETEEHLRALLQAARRTRGGERGGGNGKRGAGRERPARDGEAGDETPA